LLNGGILISRKQFGNYRFPSKKWLNELFKFKNDLKLSCHLCDAYVRELAQGKEAFINELDYFFTMFERVQINFHAIPHEYSDDMILLLKNIKNKEFIFQYDNVNTSILDSAHSANINCSALYDLSHGAGILPNEWPLPLHNIKCGYAGGLSPDNLDEQIKLIESKVCDTEIWIDMETHVRSNNDSLFDLEKVQKCLEIASKYIKK
jgi:hypothetical protein